MRVVIALGGNTQLRQAPTHPISVFLSRACSPPAYHSIAFTGSITLLTLHEVIGFELPLVDAYLSGIMEWQLLQRRQL